MTIFCGVDEAGRGPVIGPLVVAGVACYEQRAEELSHLGVKDSKQLSKRKREKLYSRIMEVARCKVVFLNARELDIRMASASLNTIEAEAFAMVIEDLSFDVAYVDAADVRPDRFKRVIEGLLKEPKKLVVEHRADENYPVVSAASIVAKVDRDRAIKGLHRVHGDFGSGYASDPKTRAFLINCAEEKGAYPDCVRKRWKTAKAALNKSLEKYC